MQYHDIYPDKKFFEGISQNESETSELFPIEDISSKEEEFSLLDNINPIFQDAYSFYKDILPYRTYTKLDRLLPKPYLLTGALNVFHASDKTSLQFLNKQLVITLILKYYRQGIVFIDCANTFPAYEIVESTFDYDAMLDPQLPVRAIQLSRSFNYHQATETIKDQLEPLLSGGFPLEINDQVTRIKPKFVFIAGLPDLYLNKESAQYLDYDGRPEWFSIHELQNALGYLKKLVVKYSVIPIITTTTAPLSKLKPLGGSYLTHSSAQLIKISTSGNGLFAELIKHPFAKYKKILLYLLQSKHKKIVTKQLQSFLK